MAGIYHLKPLVPLLFVVNLFEEDDFLILPGTDNDNARISIHQSQRAIRYCSQQISKNREAWQAHFAGKQRRMRSRTSTFQKNR